MFFRMNYIIPGIPPPGIPACIAAADSSTGSSAITHSVVNNIEAIDAAFSMAILVTFVGSITPAYTSFHMFQFLHCIQNHLFLLLLSER